MSQTKGAGMKKERTELKAFLISLRRQEILLQEILVRAVRLSTRGYTVCMPVRLSASTQTSSSSRSCGVPSVVFHPMGIMPPVSS